ncbi:unnamed protein product [Closterium sp. NIES-54]
MTAPSKPLPVSPVPPSSSSSPLPFSDASVLPSSDGSPMHGVVEQEEEEVRQECGGGDTTAERSLPTMDCDEPQGQQQQGQQRQRLQQEQKEQGQQQQQQQQQHVQLQRQLEQCTLVDGRHSHRDNITARLSFLLWALQVLALLPLFFSSSFCRSRVVSSPPFFALLLPTILPSMGGPSAAPSVPSFLCGVAPQAPAAGFSTHHSS